MVECDLQTARTDNTSTRQNGAGTGGTGAGSGSNGAGIGDAAALRQNGSSNGSNSDTVLQGTDLLEKPYSNNGNGNGAAYSNNGSSNSKQGSAGQRRQASVAGTLKDAAAVDDEAELDPLAPSQREESSASRNMDRGQETTTSSASVSQQQAAVQEASESPKAKASGSRWSKVGKYSTIQVCTLTESSPDQTALCRLS